MKQENIDKLISALRHIANPAEDIRKHLHPGEELNGQYAIALSNDAGYLRHIAYAVLFEIENG